VRRALVEAAWAGRLWPNRTRQLQRRQVGLDPAVIDIAWKAQHRLHKRYTKLRAPGRPQNLTIIALARELAGFIWAIGQRVEQPAAAGHEARASQPARHKSSRNLSARC
jgi:hypothetical protein